MNFGYNFIWSWWIQVLITWIFWNLFMPPTFCIVFHHKNPWYFIARSSQCRFACTQFLLVSCIFSCTNKFTLFRYSFAKWGYFQQGCNFYTKSTYYNIFYDYGVNADELQMHEDCFLDMSYNSFVGFIVLEETLQNFSTRQF